jgi:excisionase family DNA binding protein
VSAPVEEADPWLTLAEIAAELRVDPATVRLWISRGKLDAARAGQRKLIVRRSELDRMLADSGRYGQLRVDLPAGLRGALVAEARRQGVPLTTLTVALLAGGINWRAGSRSIDRPTIEDLQDA